MNRNLSKRLANLEQAAQGQSDATAPTSAKPAFDYEKFAQLFDAMFVTHTRAATDMPREQVRIVVANWITQLRESAKYAGVERDSDIEARIDAETDRVMALTVEEWNAAFARAH